MQGSVGSNGYCENHNLCLWFHISKCLIQILTISTASLTSRWHPAQTKSAAYWSEHEQLTRGSSNSMKLAYDSEENHESYVLKYEVLIEIYTKS